MAEGSAPRASDFSIRRIQASAFLFSEELNPTAVLKKALQMWGEIYTGEITTLPLPREAPVDIPIPLVTLTSSDETFQLEVARTRVNFHWNAIAGTSAELGDTLLTFAERLATLSEVHAVTWRRIAAVVTRVAPSAMPGTSLARHFCRDEWLRAPLNRPEGFELHAHKVYRFPTGVGINSWMRIRTVKLETPDYRHILVEQDLNTLTEELNRNRFDRESVMAWFRVAESELEHILRLYFPDTAEPEGR